MLLARPDTDHVVPVLDGTELRAALAIEKPDAQAFLVQVSLKDRAITVRLLPATDPKQKTPGVKRLLGLVARFLRGVYPGCRIGKTNLQGFLDEPVK